MRTLMKTQVPPQPNHDYRNTVVGFRVIQEEHMKKHHGKLTSDRAHFCK